MLKISELKNWEDGINQVVWGDCIDLMKKMPDNSVDLVLTDPPYGVNYEGGQNDIKREKLLNDDKAVVYKDLFQELYRILRVGGGGVYVFSATGKEKDIFPYICFDKFQVLIWNKIECGYGAMAARYHHTYEPFLYLTKKSPTKWNGGSQKKDVWKMRTNNSNELHPTQKPIWLIKEMIQNSSNKDDIIFDPFMGSWTTARACKDLERRFIGCEISEKYCEIGENRLKQENLL